MKKCFKCKIEKTFSDFYRHPGMSDGFLGKCKCCAKKDAISVRSKKIEQYRKYDRERGSRQSREYRISYKEKWPAVIKAQNKVNSAVRAGILKKTKCKCGKARVVAHHDDYLKPLDVKWMCQPCHVQWHKKNGPGKNKHI